MSGKNDGTGVGTGFLICLVIMLVFGAARFVNGRGF